MSGRKWAGTLAALGAAAAVALFGGNPDGEGTSETVGTYQGGYYGAGGAYHASSGEVSVDTFTAFFTTDTTGTLVHTLSEYGVDRTAADQIFVLGTGRDAPEFTYVRIVQDGGDPSYTPDATDRFTNIKPSLNNDWRWDYPTRAAILFRVDFEEHLGSGVTILDAQLRGCSYGTDNIANNDTIVAVLMNGTNDTQWYQSKGITAASPNMAHASWSYQQDDWGGDGAASDAHAWSPALDDRDEYWEMGGYTCDWMGVTTIGDGGDVVGGDEVRNYDILNCTQEIVNGKTNNGILLFGVDKEASSDTWGIYVWEASSPFNNRIPWFKVTYTTKRYRPPFPGGSRWAFAYSLDDGKQSINDAFSTIAAAHGGAITHYVARNHIDFTPPDDGKTPTPEKIIAWHDNGGEIGTHSRLHLTAADAAGNFPCRYDATNLGLNNWIVDDTTGACWDSLVWDCGSAWLDTMGIDYDATDRSSEPYWGDAFALPGGTFSPYPIKALMNVGYEVVRTVVIQNPQITGDFFYGAVAQIRPADTDTAWAGWPLGGGDLGVNFRLQALSVEEAAIVGAKANTAITEAQVRHNLKRHIYQVIGRKSRVVRFFSHDFKTDPDSPGYAAGTDAEEFGWICDEVDLMGGWYSRESELARWIKTRATAIPTPVGFAFPDTFTYDAAARVHFEPWQSHYKP